MQACEQVILVDEQDRELGASDKLRAHVEGALHRAFSVFVFDRAGRLLLQRRAREKYHFGSLWSNTCCGHPRPGEETAASARPVRGRAVKVGDDGRAATRPARRAVALQLLAEDGRRGRRVIHARRTGARRLTVCVRAA